VRASWCVAVFSLSAIAGCAGTSSTSRGGADREPQPASSAPAAPPVTFEPDGCRHDGVLSKDGEIFQPDPGRRCACWQGSVSCVEEPSLHCFDRGRWIEPDTRQPLVDDPCSFFVCLADGGALVTIYDCPRRR
jgi:hypothetical protein